VSLWAEHGGGITKISRIMGRTVGSISGQSMRMALQFHGSGHNRVLDPQSRAAVEGRTVFRSRVVR